MYDIKKIIILISIFFVVFSVSAERFVSVKPVIDNQEGIKSQILAKVISSDDYVLSSYVNAHVLSVVKTGTKVSKGQVIAKLDTQFLELKKKRHQVKIKKLKHLIDYLKQDLTRLEELSVNKSVQISKVDKARQELTEAEADTEIEHSLLEEVDKYIRLSSMKSKIDGVVAERFVTMGDFVDSGEVIARLINFEEKELLGNFPVEYLSVLKLGSKVNVESDGFTGQANITRILKEVVDGTQSIKVFIKPSTLLSEKLVIGMNALLHFEFPIDETVLIPNDALIPQGDKSFVYIVNNENQVKKVAIQVISGHQKKYIVRGNINKGDLVVVRGGLGLDEDDQVIIEQGVIR